LTCIANLSSDEVFTPPELAKRILGDLADAWSEEYSGENIWERQDLTFLDPCTKSGIFLREITIRLMDGLQSKIPDLQNRLDHILSKQVFGIGITKITALLARRSLYCSKTANGDHSIATKLKTEAGNIWFDRVEHDWADTKCRFCGAQRLLLDRDSELENYAYAFIHSDDVKAQMADFFGGRMQFDVVIGNPPYQMKGGAGGSSDSSIYQIFVEQAKNLEPRYLAMVTPSRWLAGGRGLDEFRAEMLQGERSRT